MRQRHDEVYESSTVWSVLQRVGFLNTVYMAEHNKEREMRHLKPMNFCSMRAVPFGCYIEEMPAICKRIVAGLSVPAMVGRTIGIK